MVDNIQYIDSASISILSVPARLSATGSLHGTSSWALNAISTSYSSNGLDGNVLVKHKNGNVTKYVGGDSDISRGNALLSASVSAIAGDTILVYGGTYFLSSSVVLPASTSLVGVGQPTLVSDVLFRPMVRVHSSSILVEGLTLLTNTCGIGEFSSTAITAQDIRINNVTVLPNGTGSSGIIWTDHLFGGTTLHNLQAIIRDSKLYSREGGLGYGIRLNATSGSLVQLFNCDVFGDTDGAVFGGVSGATVQIFGGNYYGFIDGITAGGADVFVNFAKARSNGFQGDLYRDDGTLTAVGVDYILASEQVVGDFKVPVNLSVGSTITTTRLTASFVTASVRGRLEGTASWANTASFARTASYAVSSSTSMTTTSASYSLSASYAVSASFSPTNYITGNRIFYVHPTGSDSNNGDSWLTAFQSIQYAVNNLRNYELQGNVFIRLADGTYNESVLLQTITGNGAIIIAGDTGTNPHIVGDDDYCFRSALKQTNYQLHTMTLTNMSGSCVVLNNGYINLGGTSEGTLKFGSASLYHIDATNSQFILERNYQILSGSLAHINMDRSRVNTGNAQNNTKVGSITGSLSFPEGFIIARNQSFGEFDKLRFSGSLVSGTKPYIIENNSVIWTNGTGSSIFPGDGVGEINTGGQLDNLVATGSHTISASYLNGFVFNNTSSVAAVSQSNIVVNQRETGSYTAAFFDYVVSSGSNSRAGTIISNWNNSSVQYTDYSTVDIGVTTAVTMSVALSASFIRLISNVPSEQWNIKSIGRYL